MRRVNVHTTDATTDARVICRAFEARVTLSQIGKNTRPGGAGTHTGTRTDVRRTDDKDERGMNLTTIPTHQRTRATARLPNEEAQQTSAMRCARSARAARAANEASNDSENFTGTFTGTKKNRGKARRADTREHSPDRVRLRDFCTRFELQVRATGTRRRTV